MTEYGRPVARYGTAGVVHDRATINVHVDLPNGTSRSISVEPNEQISMLKQKLYEGFEYKTEFMELFFRGRHIKDGRLSHHNIVDGARLQLRLGKIIIKVENVNGKILSMEVSHVETVYQLKERLYRETNIPVQQQALVFDSKPLDGKGTLVSHNIRCGSTIQMVGRFRGGQMS